MSRMLGANVIATSGRAVEAAGDVDVLLLDKTGTITLGNRQASEFIPRRAWMKKRWLTPHNWLRWLMNAGRPQYCDPRQAAF
ncbi:potassium-transporting ATPase B chain [Escherichia coli]|uniref:Potassium-transporting ATPase B chain n=1 Tax=Escherichia coli TaxID=562 RepID=A0A377B3B8_ECOLX|nr:potassium-transporting ATPase B chain [Escherichia coli]